jgi:cytochrome P450
VTATPTTDLPVDAIDFGDMSLWERDDWPGMFASLRHNRPVSWHTEPEIPGLTLGPGAGFWSLVRYDDVVHASRHPDVFISGQGTNIPDFPPEVYEFLGSMINMDPPRHTQFRLIVNRGFTPRRVAAIEQSVHDRARSIVEAVSAKGSCDFVTDIAAPLPLQIICDMMGIPESDYRWIFDQTNIVLGASDPEYGGEITAAFLAAQELWRYAQELRTDRLANPRDDITTAISQADVDGHSLTSEEFGSFFVLLVAAGNETTRNAISHGLLAMTEHPEQLALWQADPAGIAATGVDEVVRWGSPVIWMRRTVAADTVLGETELHEGDKVIMFYNSANRDEDVFDDPFTFDVRRSPNPHIGFGAAGPHFCLGAHLARQEIDVMFRRLFERLPDIQSVGEPDRLLSPFINGIKHLDCSFTPSAPG